MKDYQSLELEIIKFSTEDVITTSCPAHDPGCPTGQDGGCTND